MEDVMPPRRPQPNRSSERQAEQARIIEQARRHAGVAEAIDVYGRLQDRSVVVRAAGTVNRFGTGGNG
jgi:hypothetical protein